jgi:hypothetical protein
MDRSFRWGMSWFIFSEVMFFMAFFGALFYVRVLAGPWLGGEGAKGVAHMLWPSFEFAWPLLHARPETVPAAQRGHRPVAPAADQHHPAGELQRDHDHCPPRLAQGAPRPLKSGWR